MVCRSFELYLTSSIEDFVFSLICSDQQKHVFSFVHQVSVYSWADLDPVCTLKSDLLLVPGGSAVAVFKQSVTALLAGCGRCTRLTCLLTFHLEDSSGQLGPTNHHFLCSPKDAQGLQRPDITVRHLVPKEFDCFYLFIHSFETMHGSSDGIVR